MSLHRFSPTFLMSQGRVIDIMIIAFLQLTVLQFLERHTDHRNLDGIYTDVYTDVFWGLRERKKSLKEIFNEIWPLVRNNNL